MVEAILQTRKAYNSGGYNPGGGNLMTSGTATVTSGSSLSVDTGLTTILQVMVAVKTATTGTGDAAYATYNHGADGLLDLYVWDDAGAAAANVATVSWVAFGTK